MDDIILPSGPKTLASGIAGEVEELRRLGDALGEIADDEIANYHDNPTARHSTFNVVSQLYDLKLKSIDKLGKLAIQTDAVIGAAEVRVMLLGVVNLVMGVLQRAIIENELGLFFDDSNVFDDVCLRYGLKPGDRSECPRDARERIHAMVGDAVLQAVENYLSECSDWVRNLRRIGMSADEMSNWHVDLESLGQIPQPPSPPDIHLLGVKK